MKQKHKDNLLALAKFLETKKFTTKEKFDFSEFGEVEINGKGAVCGTVACAIGWAPSVPTLRKQGLSCYVDDNKLRPLLNNISLSSDMCEAWGLASASMFGTKEEQFYWLFMPADDQLLNADGTTSYYSTVTPKRIARRIRAYVKANGALDKLDPKL